MADELTVEILKQIRDGITGVREEVHGLGDRLDRMETELKSHGVKLERLDQGLSDLGQFMRGLALDYAKYERFHAQHVEVLEKDMEDLRVRVRTLEETARSGGGR